jgi:hypothetical protein
MASFEQEGSCEIIWSARVFALDDLARFTSLLLELHSEIAAPYVTSELYSDGSNVVIPPSPSVTNIRMSSPLITQLLAGPSAFEIAALGMVGSIIKKPERLGEFLPRVKEGWYRGNGKALEQQIRYVRARGELEAQGRSIERFERAMRERDIRSGGKREKPGREGRNLR